MTDQPLRTPPEHLALPAEPLARYLAETLPDFSGPLELRQFTGGQSNPTYLLVTPSARYVLRRKPPGDLLPSAHAIDREYRVMAALGRAGVPVPRMLLLCKDRSIIGSEFYVMEFLEGRIFFDTALPGMAPGERRATYEGLIDALAAIHRVDPEAAGLGDFGRPGGYIRRQTARWAKQYRASETIAIPEMERLIDWLPGAVERIPDETCLVHGDFRLDNVMLAPDRPEPVAVLDWELSTLGHPLADLSYFLMTWTFPGGLRYGMADCDLRALGIPTMGEMAARYAARTGRDDVGDLDLLVAYNAFRLAAILQGVYRRGLDGNAADAAALSVGEDVARIARIAWDHAERAGA